MFAALLAVALAAAPPPASRVITVSGDARVAFHPNQATATFILAANHRDQAGVKHAIDEKLLKFLKAVGDAGVSRSEVVINDSAPAPDYRGNEVIGYVVSRSLVLTITDLSKLDEVLSAAVRGGATPGSPVVLQCTEHGAFETKARLAAAASARERAKGLMEALGARLGLPVTVSDRTSSVESQSAGSFVAGADGAVLTGFGQKELTVTSQVTVQFEIDAPQ